jgi:hypothetical protein
MKAMPCEIVISRADRRSARKMAGKVAVGLVTLQTLGVEVAVWYLASHGVPPDTIVRVMTEPLKRRR